MCFHYSLSHRVQSIENRYNAPFGSTQVWEPQHHVNGFNYPLMPVVFEDSHKKITLMQWGLIPPWVRNQEKAAEIRSMTLNARSESAFEKPSFRMAVAARRCLVPADGFFEWQSLSPKKIPWFITLPRQEIFSFGGLWESWSIAGQEPLYTFSLLTTVANPLMAKIHNSKKRMPLIIPSGNEEKWLQKELPRTEVEALMVPLPEEMMTAWTISTLITTRGADTNTPEVKKEFPWPEVNTLF